MDQVVMDHNQGKKSFFYIFSNVNKNLKSIDMGKGVARVDMEAVEGMEALEDMAVEVMERVNQVMEGKLTIWNEIS